MASAPPLDTLIRYGNESGRAPEEIASAVQQWRKDALAEGRTLAGDNAQKYWDGSAKVESEAQAVLTGLQERKRQAMFHQLIPDPVEQKSFLDTLQKSPGNVLPADAPPEWKAVEDSLTKATDGALYEGAKGWRGNIDEGVNKLGGYEMRRTDDNNYEVLVKPEKGKPFIRQISVDRDKLIQEEADKVAKDTNDIRDETLKMYQEREGITPTPEFLDRTVKDAVAKEESAKKLDFYQNAPETLLLHERLVDSLRTDKDFLASIPENTVQQFTTRAGRKVLNTFADAFVGATDLVTGQTSSGAGARYRDKLANEASPGRLRSRFETNNNAIGDLIESGAESAITLFGPGAVLRSLGAAGKIAEGQKALSAAAEGFAATGEVAGQVVAKGLGALAEASPAAAAGWGSFFTSSYGSNYSNALTEADAVQDKDPELARKIRSMAQFSSFANASIEMLSEKIFPDENNLMHGVRPSLLSMALIPVKEGVEEAAGATAQNLVGSLADTGQASQDVVQQAKGGFFGGLPFAGLVALQRSLPNKEANIEVVPGVTQAEAQHTVATALSEAPPEAAVNIAGGEIMAQTDPTTPIEEIQAAVEDNLPEGERRRRELAAPEEPVVDTAPVEEQNPDAGQLSSSEDSGLEVPSETPASETTAGDSSQGASSPEQLSGASTEPGSGGAPAAVADPVLTEVPPTPQESREAPVTNPDNSQAVVAELSTNPRYADVKVAQAPNNGLAKFAQQVAGISGRTVIFVKGLNQTDGVQSGNNLFVNIDGKQSIRKVIGHELGHSLENVEGYQKLVKILQNRDRAGYGNYLMRLKDAGYEDSQIQSEYVADVIGEAIKDRGFWRSISQETDPTVFQRIVDALSTVIDKIQNLWQTSGFVKDARLNASPFVKNLTEAREVIRGLIQQGTPAKTGTVNESGPQESRGVTKKSKRQMDGYSTHLITEVVQQSVLQEIAAKFIPSVAKKVASATEGNAAMKKLRDRDGPLQQAIAREIDSVFAARLNKLDPTEREAERLVLRAQVQQKMLNSASRLAASFNAKGAPNTPTGRENRKRAKSLYSQLARTADSNISLVPGNRFAQARILQSSQFITNTEFEDFMADYYGQVVAFSEQKGLEKEATQEAQAAVDAASRSQGAKETALSATPEGRKLVKAKGKILTAAHALWNRIIGRESRSGPEDPEQVDKLLSALARLETDYNGGIEQFMELADEAIQNLSGEKQRAALSELQDLAQMDIDLADQEEKLLGQNRQWARVTENFIEPKTKPPRTVSKSAARQDLAQMRLAVREGSLTVEEAGDLFVARGGAETRRAAFIKAIAEDAHSTLQQEELKADAAAAKQQKAAAKKTTKEEARAAREAQKAALKEDVRVTLEAADRLKAEDIARVKALEDTRREVAENEKTRQKWQDSQDKLEKKIAADNLKNDVAAAKAAGDELVKAAKELAKANAEKQKLEAKQKKLEDQEVAKLKKYNDEADAGAERLQSLADRIFSRGASAIKGGRATTVEQDILNTINDNAEWEVADAADREKIIAEVLKRRGFDDRFIAEGVAAAKAAFDAKMKTVASNVARTLGKLMSRGKISVTAFENAIRLNLLDPSRGLAEDLAALQGWKGMTPAEWSQMVRNAEQARGVTDPQVALALWNKNARIIHRSSMPPSFKEVLVSFIRATTFQSLSTISLQGFTSINSLLIVPLRHAMERVATNPLEFLSIMGETVRAWKKSLVPALRSGWLGFWHNAGLALPSSEEKGKMSVGIAHVEAALRSMDLSIQTLKSNASLTAKTKAMLHMLIVSGPTQLLWRVFALWDSFNIAFQRNFNSQVFLNKDLQEAKVSPKQLLDQFNEATLAGEDYGVRELGLSPALAKSEAAFRNQMAWFDFLRGKTEVNPAEADKDAFYEAVNKMGNHAEVQGRISEIPDLLSKLADKVPFGLGPLVFNVLRMPANILDAMTWYLPGYNIIRYVKEARAIKRGEGRFTLAARSERLLHRRRAEVIYGNLLFGSALALFMSGSGDDDDPDTWIRYYGAAPINPTERQAFFLAGKKEYSLVLGKKAAGQKQLQINLTRGVAEFLNLPLLAAKHTAEVIKGREALSVAAGRAGADLLSIGLPAVQRFAQSSVIFTEGNKKRIEAEIANRLSPLIPFSGITRSLAKTQPPLSRDDPHYLLSQLIPSTVFFTKDGLEFRNFLNENPYAEDDAFNVMARVGLPVNLISERGSQDPVIREMFVKMGYSLAPVESIDDFKKYYAGREDAVLKANGVDTEKELRDKWISVRADIFKGMLKNPPEVGDSSKDQRTLQQIIDAGDKPAFKLRVGNLRGQSTKQAKEKMGLTVER